MVYFLSHVSMQKVPMTKILFLSAPHCTMNSFSSSRPSHLTFLINLSPTVAPQNKPPFPNARFSNEDRSRFLRFVTGRRRLPTPLYVCADRGEIKDALPESSTCSNTLFLPNYSSVKIAEEKLRYAAYNCIAIDTDMSPWDE